MKNYLKSDIEGKGFFKTYIFFLIPLVVLAVIINSTDESAPLVSAIASLAESWLSMLLWFAVFSYIVKFVEFKETRFDFTGQLGEVAPKLLKWYLLTIITLGFYSPWMIKHIADYILDKTAYNENTGELKSQPGTLLKYILLTVYLPVIILTIIFVVFMLRNVYSDTYMYGPGFGIFIFLFILIMFLILVPFMYYYLTWLLNIRYGVNNTEFRRSMGEIAGFIIPQILLSIITIFIYYPAAVVKTYRFIIEGSVYCDENGAEKGEFGFDGTAGRGFCLMWGQGLLCLITIGIYGPWAIAKLCNWWFNNTWIEEKVQ